MVNYETQGIITTGETVGWKALTSLTKRSGVRIPIKALVASRRWPVLGKCAWCVVFAFMPRGDAGISPAVLGYPAWVCVLPNLTKANPPPIKKKRSLLFCWLLKMHTVPQIRRKR